MTTTLTDADRRVILIAIVVSGIALAIGVKYFSQAFPEAAIEFRVNRDDSAPLATKFLADRGWNVDGYRHAAVFGFDDDARVYLERTQGVARMDDLTRGPLHLWHWSHRWFKPQQKEEFRVDVTPTGQVVGFDRDLPEAAPGANLDPAAARTIAEKFLTEGMRQDLAHLEFVDSESEKRPARTDYTFTWKERDVNLGEGSLRAEVEVDGDQVGSYREFVKIPEGWTRDYKKLRSRNEAANIVDEVPWLLLCVAGIGLLILRLRKRDVPVRFALNFGLATAVLFFLGQLNMFSQAEYGYRTTDSYSSFVSSYLVENLLAGLGIGALIFMLVASTEPVYRDAYPQAMSMRRYFTWHGLRTRSFFLANVVGIALTFFFFAYQTVFYLTADKLGAWAPREVPFSDLLNTRFPWTMVLFIGFLPAVSEEFQFRAFAIPLVRKLLKSGPLAIILPAFVWGFLHSLYPNQPFYIRGLEVGLGGVIIGFVMLRFGILATLIWHYSVDALYTAFLLLRSPNHYLMVSGGVAAGIMLIPLAVALVAYLTTGTFTEEESVQNSTEKGPAPLAAEVPTTETSLEYQPLSDSRLMLAGVFIALFVALAFLPAYRFGKGIVLRLSSHEALSVGDAFMRQQKLEPTTYRHVVWLNDNVDSRALHYLAERRSLEQSDQIYRQATRLALWQVRYYRPLQKEEYLVIVDPSSGEVFAFHHVLDDDAPGASLSSGQARALAEQAVRDHGYRLEDFELQSSDAKKQKAREDYTLIWQAKPGDPRDVGDAHYRLEVDIAGDQVVRFLRSFKLPEDWLRAQDANTVTNNILLSIRVLAILGLVAAGLGVLVTLVRAGKMPWGRSAKIGAFVGVMAFLGSLNSLPLINARYDTSMPLAIWRVVVAVSLSVLPLLEGLLAWLLIGCALGLFPDAWKVFHGAARRIWRRDAIVALVLSLASGVALSRVDAILTQVLHVYAPINDDLFPATLSTFWPAAGVFLSGLGRALPSAALAALIIYVVRTGWRLNAPWFWPALAVVLVALGPTHAHSLAAFGAGWVTNFVPVFVMALLVGLFFRGNILAYVLAIFTGQVAGGLVDLFAPRNRFFLQNGVALALLAGAVLAWALCTFGEEAKSA